MKWLMRLIASVIISLMGGIPLLRRAGTFPVLLLCRGSAFLFIPFFHLMRTGSCLGLSGRYSQQAAPCIWSRCPCGGRKRQGGLQNASAGKI